MADPRFPILGPVIAPLIGRAKVMQRLWSDLTKPSPSHLSVVGPRYSGKSVVLHALAQRISATELPYSAVILWDLGHQTPESDGAFIAAVCQRLGDSLRTVNASYSKHLLSLGEENYQELREVVEILDSDGIKVLMLWDGFDKPLATGKLTRNLWDQLRELASYSSLRLVTATRQNLQELIRSEESVSSDFWNIFDPVPVRLGVFDDTDRDAVYAETGRSFFSSARTELDNWTGGHPPLFLALVNEVIEICPNSGADNDTVNQAAARSIEKVSGILDALWADCAQPSKDLYCHLFEQKEIAASAVVRHECAALSEKGFIKATKSTFSIGCRLLENHIKSKGTDTGSLMRLFGSLDNCRSNIRGLLELRLDQIPSLDRSLHRFLERSIEDLPDYPEVCLANVRGIVDRVLDLIWDAELGNGRQMPSEWFTEWQFNGEKGAESYWKGQFPAAKRGHQIRLLQLLTGTDKTVPKAQHVSKNVFALANAAHGFGDFGQHIENVSVPLGVAVAAVVICLELAACLQQELTTSATKQ